MEIILILHCCRYHIPLPHTLVPVCSYTRRLATWDSVDTVENSSVFSLIQPNALLAVSKGIRAVKLCSNKILQFLTNAGWPVTCKMAIKRWWLLARREQMASENEHVSLNCKQKLQEMDMLCYQQNIISVDKASLWASQMQLSLATRGSLDVQCESVRMHAGAVFCQTDTQCRTQLRCSGRVHVLSPPQHLQHLSWNYRLWVTSSRCVNSLPCCWIEITNSSKNAHPTRKAENHISQHITAVQSFKVKCFTPEFTRLKLPIFLSKKVFPTVQWGDFILQLL